MAGSVFRAAQDGARTAAPRGSPSFPESPWVGGSATFLSGLCFVSGSLALHSPGLCFPVSPCWSLPRTALEGDSQAREKRVTQSPQLAHLGHAPSPRPCLSVLVSTSVSRIGPGVPLGESRTAPPRLRFWYRRHEVHLLSFRAADAGGSEVSSSLGALRLLLVPRFSQPQGTWLLPARSVPCDELLVLVRCFHAVTSCCDWQCGGLVHAGVTTNSEHGVVLDITTPTTSPGDRKFPAPL